MKTLFAIVVVAVLFCSSARAVEEVDEPMGNQSPEVGRFVLLGGLGFGLGSYSIGPMITLQPGYAVAPKLTLFTEASFSNADFYASDYGTSGNEKIFLLGARYQFWRFMFAKAGVGYREMFIKKHNYSSAPYETAKADDVVLNLGSGMLWRPKSFIFGWDLGFTWAMSRHYKENTYTYNDQPISKLGIEIKGLAGFSF